MILVGIAALISVSASATIYVNWSGLAGFYNYNATPTGNYDDPANYAGASTAYLIWSPDATAGFDLSNAANGYADTAVNGEVVLQTFAVSSDFADFAYGNFVSAAYSSGYVYARIVDTSGPGGATQYYTGDVDAVSVNPLLPSDTSNNSVAGLAGAGDKMVLVPEPATFAFIGIGGLLLALRRMRRA